VLSLLVTDSIQFKLVFHAKEVLSAKTQTQTQVVDLANRSLLRAQPFESFEELFPGIPGLKIFKLEGKGIPLVMMLPTRVLEDGLIRPCKGSKAGVLVISVQDAWRVAAAFSRSNSAAMSRRTCSYEG
jgi:hypothetical protein